MPPMIFTIFLTISLITLASAFPHQRRQEKARIISHCTVPNTVALSFPWKSSQSHCRRDIVDTLKAAGATGTFFFNGRNWGCIYDQNSIDNVLYAYNNGMQIASHTWSHSHLNSLTQAQEAIEQITRALPACMRPPYGEYNDVVLEVAASRGQSVVLWDFECVSSDIYISRRSSAYSYPYSSGDSTGAPPATQMANYDALVERRPNTTLSLEHEIIESSAHQVVPYAVHKLKSAGYRLVTVAECLGMPPYQRVSDAKAQQSVSCTKYLFTTTPSFTDFF
ncbi:carbohydrate esterase family 4 protein [Laccaria bicolor S238N-H82]|uniref:Carbohydrate esterase family 4 protein n=1 Tax=Laccaria bicolor (strain S238N-H82 / ATCC MYA-4686) TaxID=486041 RepID=B0DQI5_LACBS|nr:carbohydrate esterase family 4 protein [Laccaria bicolor S238N-H82]EDR03118.1 carbohydrate esterase family 4 protein [Laccaria bicolor S238N-H82]|eukprot:XP_001886259.1 carbohydrate esterase family 4 protein [Laccaria bicolor S238N-H82]